MLWEIYHWGAIKFCPSQGQQESTITARRFIEQQKPQQRDQLRNAPHESLNINNN